MYTEPQDCKDYHKKFYRKGAKYAEKQFDYLSFNYLTDSKNLCMDAD